MTGLEALQSVQYVAVGKARFAVIDVDDWESLIEWLETLEDVQVANEAFAQLRAFGGDRARVGWHRWDEVRSDPCLKKQTTVDGP
jgi:hypothetical protein